MKRYGSRRNDNEYGDRAPVHGAKSSRARAKSSPEAKSDLFDEPVIVVRRPFVPNVKLIRESFAKFYGDHFDDETVSVLCPDTARRADVADDADSVKPGSSENPDESEKPVSD